MVLLTKFLVVGTALERQEGDLLFQLIETIGATKWQRVTLSRLNAQRLELVRVVKLYRAWKDWGIPAGLLHFVGR